MHYFVVRYTYTADSELANQHRPAHREYISTLCDQGLVASGPWVGAEEPGAMLLFHTQSADVVADLLDRDPFLEHGVIAAREIAEWNPVIGTFAE